MSLHPFFSDFTIIFSFFGQPSSLDVSLLRKGKNFSQTHLFAKQKSRCLISEKKAKFSHKLTLFLFRRLKEKEEERLSLTEYWDSLYRTSAEDAQPFIIGYLTVSGLVFLAVLISVYAGTLRWKHFCQRK